MKKKAMGIVIMLIFSSFNTYLYAQNIVLNPTVGFSLRTTIMNVFNFKETAYNPYISYIHEKSIQGLALDLGIQINSNHFGFEYNPRFRYDYLYHRFGPNNKHLIRVINGDSIFVSVGEPETIKEFIIDHNFNFYVNKKIKYGAGFNIINTGKDFFEENPKGNIWHVNIEYKAFSGFILIPVNHVNLELKALYFPESLNNHNMYDDYLSYSLRVFYTFQEKRKE